MGVFGEKLRRQREQRGIELEAISNTTKIGTRMLRALEEEQFDQLPGGVFNKGFVRAYARHVGLDEEEAITDYLAALRESQVHAQQIMPNLRQKPSDVAAPELAENRRHEIAGNHRDQARAGQSNANRRNADQSSSDRGHKDRSNNSNNKSRNHEKQKVKNLKKQDHQGQDKEAHSPTSRSVQPSAPAMPAAKLAAVRSYLKYSAGVLSEASEISNRIPWTKLAAVLLLVSLIMAIWAVRHDKRSGASQPATSAANDSRSVSAAPPVVSSAAPVSNSSGNAPSSKPTRHSSAGNGPAPFRLLIRASETSWVSITADGNPVAHETLIAPANTSVRATREIVVRTGNAAGLSFLLNGKEIPVQGSEGETKTYTFGADGLREPTPQ